MPLLPWRSWESGRRADAERMTPVLTPQVVTALGEEFLGTWTAAVDAPETVGFFYLPQGNYAFAALLIAAGDPSLAAAAAPLLEKTLELVPRMTPKQAENVFYLSGLWPELEVAQRLNVAAESRLSGEPESVAERWAREVGLDLPHTYWSLSIAIPATTTLGRVDANIYADIKHFPGNPSTWNIRIGALSRDPLGSNYPWRGPELAAYERTIAPSNVPLAGAILPASDPLDFPRVLADIEQTHADLRFDRSALSASGGPGRLATPTRKKQLIAWLGGTSI